MFCHYLFATDKILEKIQIIWGRATGSLIFEWKSNKLKSVQSNWELAT